MPKLSIHDDHLSYMESVEAKIEAMRVKSAKRITDLIVQDFKKRFPKRSMRLTFGGGGHAFYVDDTYIDESSREAGPFTLYFDLLDRLSAYHWDYRGVSSDDIEVEPRIIRKLY